MLQPQQSEISTRSRLWPQPAQGALTLRFSAQAALPVGGVAGDKAVLPLSGRQWYPFMQVICPVSLLMITAQAAKPFTCICACATSWTSPVSTRQAHHSKAHRHHPEQAKCNSMHAARMQLVQCCLNMKCFNSKLWPSLHECALLVGESRTWRCVMS